MADGVIVTPRKNGPYMVQGPIKIVDAEGKEIQVQGGTVFLCR